MAYPNYQTAVTEIMNKFDNPPNNKKYGLFILLNDIIQWLGLPLFDEKDTMEYGDFKTYSRDVRYGIGAVLSKMLIDHKICLAHEKFGGEYGYWLLHPSDHLKWMKKGIVDGFKKVIKKGRKHGKNMNMTLLSSQEKVDHVTVMNNLTVMSQMVNGRQPNTQQTKTAKKRGRPTKKPTPQPASTHAPVHVHVGTLPGKPSGIMNINATFNNFGSAQAPPP